MQSFTWMPKWKMYRSSKYLCLWFRLEWLPLSWAWLPVNKTQWVKLFSKAVIFLFCLAGLCKRKRRSLKLRMLIQKYFHPIVQHHFYFGAYLSNYSYNSNLFWGDEKNWFQKLKKIIFSSHQNELSDLNKTYIDISNGQKFELLAKYILENLKSKPVKDWVVFLDTGRLKVNIKF